MTRRGQPSPVAEKWAIRLTPLFVVLAIAYATYAVPVHLCIDFLYHDQDKPQTAAALLTLYFLFFLLTVTSYGRTYYSALFHPGTVPFFDRGTPEGELNRIDRGRHKRDDPEAPTWVPPDTDPDSPGLDAFYSKEAFICEADGYPRWCSDCRQWKPDRARHSRELRRCVRKMDHMCPWVGGMVAETSFNFFLQFTFWCTFYLAVCIAASAYCIALQQHQHLGIDGRAVAALALSGFFIIFSFSMTLGSMRFLFTNTTNIDVLQKAHVAYVAVRIPLDAPGSPKYPTITYPLVSHDRSSMQSRNSQNGAAVDEHMARDRQASRRFAVLRTDEGENPFDVGYRRNFTSVMGHNPLEWFLPIAHSPCCNHDSMVSDYAFGPLLQQLKQRYNVPEVHEGV